MYILMYMMVDRFENVYASWNQFYMAGMMTAAMVLIEIFVMKEMYKDMRANAIIVGCGSVALILFIFFTRTQFAISEKDFLRSMISHHASALLMCQQNTHIQDPEIKTLCHSILTSQQSEITFMQEKLLRYDR
jgi:uncharacterized protein (DUF305 family)